MTRSISLTAAKSSCRASGSDPDEGVRDGPTPAELLSCDADGDPTAPL